MKFLTQLILLVVLCLPLHAQIDRYKKNILTTNDVVLGSSMTLTGGVLEAVAGIATVPSLYYGGQFGFGTNDIALTNILSSNLASGTVDLFTVPAGRRFFITQFALSTTNQVTGTAYVLLKTNGNYFRITPNGTNVKTNVPNTLQLTANTFTYLFEPGESVAVNNTQNGGNVWVGGLLFPTNSPIYSPKLLSLSVANQTLYTCPAGKCAVNFSFSSPGNITLGYAVVWNDSGGSRTIKTYVVPNGGTADASNIFMEGPLADKAFTFIYPGIMFPGDSIVIAADAATATQWATVTVAEIPFP